VLRNKNGDGIEHFGFVDGLSQPLFLQADRDAASARDQFNHWDPSAPLSLALLRDPYMAQDDCFGSYLVFRKLEQNVRRFTRHEKILGLLGLTETDAERAGAMIVGRFRDGTPVTLSPVAGMPNPMTNNFDYTRDKAAMQCPYQAHIRKTNPRGEGGGNLDDQRGHRIARRGIPYGARQVEPKDEPSIDQMPTAGVGLLFMCFQASIVNQFKFIQSTWANSSISIETGLREGFDPVIGQQQGGGNPGRQRWPLEWGKPPTMPFDFGGFVTMKGGEFFFAPSIPFLKNL